MITFAFDHCKNIQLNNVSIDFERPSMSELTFVQVSDTAIVADIHPDSKYDIINNQLVFYGEGWTMHHYHAILVKPGQGSMFYSSWNPFLKSTATVLSANRVIFKGNFSGTHFMPGEVLTIRDPIRDHVGAFINRSQNISLRNVSLHYMHGLGIVSQFSENLHYDSIYVTPSRGRQIAAFADGMHFSGCKGNILVENCHFKGLHDDPVNVHGTHLQVTEIRSPTSVKVKFMHAQTYGFEAFFKGDSVGFTRSASLQTFGYGVVKAATLISEREMLIEFERSIPSGIQNGDCLENITWTPALTIRNCRFEGTNTRGLLVTTRRKVLIEDNVFYRTGMHAILIANDASGWFESGPV
ncbi:MAG TPA: right-handed parallel beta-helix repeat-containing protein, partial [Cyclobacteriaceae bacterium]|nr:right-handed parallel beta-helix repeat-containing protein [Cyclobacteriaceae bacterium]